MTKPIFDWQILRAYCKDDESFVHLVELLSQSTDLSINSHIQQHINDEQATAQHFTYFDTLPIPVYIWEYFDSEKDFQLIHYNDKADEITNGAVNKLLGAKANTLYADSPSIVHDMLTCLKSKGQVEREMNYHFRTTGHDRVLITRYAYASPNYVMVLTEDVTEQRQNQESVQAYERIVSSTSDGIALISNDGIYRIVNEAYLQRRNLSREQIIGKHLTEYLESTVFEREVKPYFERALNGERAKYSNWFSFETLGKRYLQVVYSPYRDDDGDIWGVIVTTRDVTDLKTAQEKIEEQHQFLQTIYSESELNIFVLDRDKKGDFRYSFLSDVFKSTTDLEPSSILGLTPLETVPTFVSEDNALSMMARYQLCIQRKHSISYEEELLINGRLTWWYTTLSPILDHLGETIRIIGHTFDITERKKTQMTNEAYLEDIKALQRIHLELDKIDTLDDLYKQMIILARKHLGLERIGIFRLDDGYLQGTFGIDPDGNLRNERDLRPLVKENSWIPEIDLNPMRVVVWQNTDLIDYGEVMSVGWRVASALWNGSKIIGYLVCDNHISHRALRPYETELVAILANTFGHLIQQKENEKLMQLANVRELELRLERDRMKLLSSFIQSAAHEFRIPLATIQTANHLMLKIDDDIKRESKSEQISSQVQRLSTLVDTMLLMVELDNTKYSSKPLSIINLSSLVKSVCDEFSFTSDNQLNIDTHLTHPMKMRGVASELHIAFRHILENAQRAISKQGTISVISGENENTNWIKITDDGVGIQPENLSHIFTAFWRFDIAHTTPGLGLGLTIAKRIIERHGGAISVESEQGKETTFTISFPIEVLVKPNTV